MVKIARPGPGCSLISMFFSLVTSLLASTLVFPFVQMSQSYAQSNAYDLDATPFVTLSLPIECGLSDDCAIANYVDIEPGESVQNYIGLRRSYNGHKGVDFSIGDTWVMERGVNVLAAMRGVVVGVRNYVEDISINDLRRRYHLGPRAIPLEIKNKQCGNGIRIDHGHGWFTQYCHLKKDSVLVQKGATVRRGQQLGEVGLSGQTEFPHLHFQVEYIEPGTNIRIFVDPFTGTSTSGKRIVAQPLWEAEVLAEAVYEPHVVNFGFSSEVVTGNYNERMFAGLLARQPVISATANSLQFFAQIFGIERGDRVSVKIVSPPGRILSRSSTVRTEANVVYTAHTGKGRGQNEWKSGTYGGDIEIIRQNPVQGPKIVRRATSIIVY
jgi:murein DD-endopeptidase